MMQRFSGRPASSQNRRTIRSIVSTLSDPELVKKQRRIFGGVTSESSLASSIDGGVAVPKKLL